MELPSLRRCTVRRLLVDIAFKRAKRSHNSLLIDRDVITDWRNRYLRDVERYRAEGRKILLLDETWVMAGQTRRNTAVRAGCIVLRLPPYHCECNAIELVWAKLKNGFATDNRDFKLSMVDAILRYKIKQVTAEDWRESIQHVMDVEAKFRLDTSGSEHIQPIINQLGEDDTDESDGDCELLSRTANRPTSKAVRRPYPTGRCVFEALSINARCTTVSTVPKK
ncbi:hypothetical protein MRX96_032477 [Rhipicephalus microplus]